MCTWPSYFISKLLHCKYNHYIIRTWCLIPAIHVSSSFDTITMLHSSLSKLVLMSLESPFRARWYECFKQCQVKVIWRCDLWVLPTSNHRLIAELARTTQLQVKASYFFVKINKLSKLFTTKLSKLFTTKLSRLFTTIESWIQRCQGSMCSVNM